VTANQAATERKGRKKLFLSQANLMNQRRELKAHSHCISSHVLSINHRFEWPGAAEAYTNYNSDNYLTAVSVSLSFYRRQSDDSQMHLTRVRASAADGKDVYLMPNITRGGKPSIKLFINSARI
jgi:hypothetical protein